MPERRHFAFLGAHRVSIAMDTEILDENRSRLVFALAFCCGKDQFEKKIARKILNGRLDKRINEGVRDIHTFQIEYEGTTPRRDVMYVLMDVIRNTIQHDSEETPSAARKRSWQNVNNCRNHILLAAAGRRVPTVNEFKSAAEEVLYDPFGLCSDPELREVAEQIHRGPEILSVEESC